jgi:hypothetical protein
VGFEASVRVSLIVGLMIHYERRYEIILAAMPAGIAAQRECRHGERLNRLRLKSRDRKQYTLTL